MRTWIALVIVVVGNHIGGRGRMIDTTDEAAGANQIQIQDFKSSMSFIQLFMTMMLLEGNILQMKQAEQVRFKFKTQTLVTKKILTITAALWQNLQFHIQGLSEAAFVFILSNLASHSWFRMFMLNAGCNLLPWDAGAAAVAKEPFGKRPCRL